jgi:hypothetical protein
MTKLEELVRLDADIVAKLDGLSTSMQACGRKVKVLSEKVDGLSEKLAGVRSALLKVGGAR